MTPVEELTAARGMTMLPCDWPALSIHPRITPQRPAPWSPYLDRELLALQRRYTSMPTKIFSGVTSTSKPSSIRLTTYRPVLRQHGNGEFSVPVLFAYPSKSAAPPRRIYGVEPDYQRLRESDFDFDPSVCGRTGTTDASSTGSGLISSRSQ